MNIAIVHWPINDVGGINSWGENFIKGLRANGHTVQLYYCTPQGRFECYPNKKLRKLKWSILPAYHLSYKPEHLKKTIETLNQYNLIVFLHPSPHPTGLVMKVPYGLNWQEIFRGTKPAKLCVFHDMWWQKNNAWLAEVANHVDACLAAQRLFVDSVALYPSRIGVPKHWEYFPLDLEAAESCRRTATKIDRAVCCTQWLKIKNHDKLLPQLPDVKYPVHFYGFGEEYYQLRIKGIFPLVMGMDHKEGRRCNKKSKHQFHGFRPYEEVLQAMAEARVSIDLSTKGHTNMTHWEPMTVGTVSMAERRVVEHPHNQIPADCLWMYDLDDVGESINSAIADRQECSRIVERALKFVQKCDCRLVANRIIDWLQREHVVPRLRENTK